MPKEIFAENHEYIIYNLSEEDKDNYFELQSQLTGGKWKTDEELRNALWNYLHNISRDNHFSVFSREKGYCGDLILKNPQSNTPEIGLDLLESMRNKGIAGERGNGTTVDLSNKKVDSPEIENVIVTLN